MARDHVVFLVHGIRTQAEWQQTVAQVLESDPSIRVVPTRYEFFDLGRFLLPIPWFRNRPVQRLTRLIRDEISKGHSQVSVVAHSFGTWAVCQILDTQPDIRFRRLIFCGSVVPDQFEWERHGHRLQDAGPDSWQVVNDCGHLDIWPVLADSITWGYGSSGRFGFGHNRVKDRFHRARHSDFFSEAFVRDFWLPFLSSGHVAPGLAQRPKTPWLLSLLTVVPLKAVLLTAALIGLVLAWPGVGVEPPTATTAETASPQSPALAEDPAPSQVASAGGSGVIEPPLPTPLLSPSDFRLPDCLTPPPTPAHSSALQCVETPQGWRSKQMWNLSLLLTAVPRSSSVRTADGYHRTEYLNDGWANNGRSWLPVESDTVGHCTFPVWAEIDLGQDFEVHAVAVTNELTPMHNDRGAEDLSIDVTDSSQKVSRFAAQVGGGPLRGRREFAAAIPTTGRTVRVTINRAESGFCPRLDEIEVIGRRRQIVTATPDPGSTRSQ